MIPKSTLWARKNRERHRELAKNWRKHNPEKVKEFNRVNREKDIEKYRKDRRDYMRKNWKRFKPSPEKRKIYARNWYLKNKQKVADYQRARKYRKRAGGNLTRMIIEEVYQQNIDKYGVLTCILCGNKINGGATLEHKKPLIRGGNNSIRNLGVAHRNCNSRKKHRTMQEWKKYKKTIGDLNV